MYTFVTAMFLCNIDYIICLEWGSNPRVRTQEILSLPPWTTRASKLTVQSSFYYYPTNIFFLLCNDLVLFGGELPCSVRQNFPWLLLNLLILSIIRFHTLIVISLFVFDIWDLLHVYLILELYSFVLYCLYSQRECCKSTCGILIYNE